MHFEERIGEGPATDRRQYFQSWIGFLHCHQLAEVTFVGLVPAVEASPGLLQCGPRVVNRHLEVLTARTGALQRFEAVTPFDGFQAVVDAIAAADWNEAIQNVVKVSCRDFIHREFTVINAPLREIGTDHFIGMLREGFIIFLHGGVKRQQMATVGIRDDNQFAGAGAAPAGIAEFNRFLIATAFGHFKCCRAGHAACTGPDGFAVEQHFR